MRQRLLYIYYGDFYVSSGVTAKLRGLFNAFENENVDWVVFAFNAKVKNITFENKNYYFLPTEDMKNQSMFYGELTKFILNSPSFDFTYFRYPLANKFLFEFLKMNPNVIFEHNTKEIAETFQQGLCFVKKFKFRFSPSYFKLIYGTLLKPTVTEFYYGKKCLNIAKFGVAVTQEIAEYEMSRTRGYHCQVVSNGVDVGRIRWYERKFVEGDCLMMLMLMNSNQIWHGLDLILDSFSKYKGDKIKLCIVGNISKDMYDVAMKNPNVILTGFLEPEAFEQYVENAHIGIGSLSLFRINLEEASPLKVREYLASGLPVMVGYKDTDIESSSLFKSKCIAYDLRKDKIDWLIFYKNVMSLYKEQDLNKKLRNESESLLDFSVKAKKMLNIL